MSHRRDGKESEGRRIREGVQREREREGLFVSSWEQGSVMIT